MRAGLHAGVALPAHIGLDVVGTTISLIDVHDVGWADIHAMSTAVAAGHINKGWHDVPLSPVKKVQRKSNQ